MTSLKSVIRPAARQPVSKLSKQRRAELLQAEREEAELKRRRTARPLAFAQLWHRELPRTSQRRAMETALGPQRIVFVNGGNRAGKTDVGAQWAVAHALGRDHPDVVRWARINGLDVSRIPKGPGMVWAVSLTFPDSRRYVRAKLDKYLPKGTRKRNWDAENEAEAILPNGGKVVCKAWKQGREGFQGDSIRALWTDEEPGDESAWNEALMRTVDQNGRSLVTFTPGLKGLTWVYYRYAEKPPDNVATAHIYGEDNPYLSPEVLLEVLSGFGEKEQESRRYGRWVQLEGRIYPWEDAVHLVDPFDVPADWMRWQGWDWGARSPHAVWMAESPTGDFFVYREVAPRRKTEEPGIPDRAFVSLVIGAETETHQVRHWYRVADSEAPGAIEEAASCLLYTSDAADE